jgi:transposase
MTTLLPPNVKVHLALGFIDMRKGIDGLPQLISSSSVGIYSDIVV